MADASTREVQRLAAMGRSMAKAAFMQSSQRNGSCTKRSLGKCCQSILLTDNIRSTLTALQAESSIHGDRSTDTVVLLGGQPGACPELVVGAAVSTCFVWRENQIAKTRTPISASAMVETRTLKRLWSGSAMVVKIKLSCGRTPGDSTSLRLIHPCS